MTTKVRMVGHHLSNCPGDICLFPEQEAAELVERGLAVDLTGNRQSPVVPETTVPVAAATGGWIEAPEPGEEAPAAKPASSPLPAAWTKNAPRRK